MSMNRVLAHLGIMFVWIVFSFQTSNAQSIATNIKFCRFTVSKNLRIGHANFTVITSFRVGSDEKPNQIKQIGNFRVAQGEMETCLSDWQFAGLSSASILLARFRWEHGAGWTEMTVSGKELELRLMPAVKPVTTVLSDRRSGDGFD